MQPSSISRSAFAFALLATGFLLASTRAQAPHGPQSGAENLPPASPRTFPAPTNLQVLPKDFSGQQVHDLMQQWAYSLGVRCDSCHVEDHNNPSPDGRPRLNFADDSKRMKGTARIMYTMTEEMNSKFIAKVEGTGMPMTCGTCHRGQISPEPFAMPPPDGSSSAQDTPVGGESQQSK